MTGCVKPEAKYQWYKRANVLYAEQSEVDAIIDSTYDDNGDIYDNEFQSLHNDSPNDLHHVSSSAVESFFEDPSISEFINDLDPSEREAYFDMDNP